jgi:hypothetical protein
MPLWSGYPGEAKWSKRTPFDNPPARTLRSFLDEKRLI